VEVALAKKITRTPTRATGGVTPEEQVRLREHAELWKARVLRTTPIEPDKIVPAIEGLYEAARLERPRVVVVPSPLAMAFAYGAASAIMADPVRRRLFDEGPCKAAAEATREATRDATSMATQAAVYEATRDATSDATHAATAAAVRAATSAATRDATSAATRAATSAATRDATSDATYAATSMAVHAATQAATQAAVRAATSRLIYDERGFEGAVAQACFDLAGEAGLTAARNWWNVYQGGNMWGSYDCYLTAMRDVIGLDLPEYRAYSWYEQAAIHGGFRVMHRDFCIVSDFPEFIRMDDQNRPHCETGPSHRWRDGWSLYYWHGVRIPGWWIDDRERLDAKTALKWDNIEQRRAACEIVGWNRILRELDAVTIDRDDDPEVGELVSVIIPDVGREQFLRVRCGTGREFALPVPPDMVTALQANAWTYGLDETTFDAPEVRT
jgi:hypothetical protein